LAGGTGNLDATVSGVSQHFLAALRAKEFEFAHQALSFLGIWSDMSQKGSFAHGQRGDFRESLPVPPIFKSYFQSAPRLFRWQKYLAEQQLRPTG
jgi:hypothetical protein